MGDRTVLRTCGAAHAGVWKGGEAWATEWGQGLGSVVRHRGASLSSSLSPGALHTSWCVLGTSKEPTGLTGRVWALEPSVGLTSMTVSSPGKGES